MSQERDPRVDPRPGDILQHRYGAVPVSIDFVDMVHPGFSRVAYTIEFTKREPCRCTLGEWQAWAKTATIIHKADQ